MSEILKLETTATTEPVIGEVATRLDFESPKRGYVARSQTKAGTPSWLVVLGASIRGQSRDRMNMEIELKDLRAVAAMLIAHADALGIEVDDAAAS